MTEEIIPDAANEVLHEGLPKSYLNQVRFWHPPNIVPIPYLQQVI